VLRRSDACHHDDQDDEKQRAKHDTGCSHASRNLMSRSFALKRHDTYPQRLDLLLEANLIPIHAACKCAASHLPK
jgi:hypothetical protein